MTSANKQAIEDLASDSPHQRLRAARILAKQGKSSDLPAMRAALQRETVSWVRRALLTAIDVHGPTEPKHLDPDQPETTNRDIKAEAVHEVTRTLLHEFEPMIGVLKMHAELEIPNYDASKVKIDLARLDGLVDAIRTLKKASSSPVVREFELSSFIKEIASEYQDDTCQVSTIGPEPLMVESDPDLLRLALANGLRNAIEATDLVRGLDPHAVTVTWGITDIDVWIAVLDTGPGLVSGSQGAFEIGRTTKRDHSGMGLPIAKQAMDSLEGQISLVPNSPTGARFEIRWYRGRQQ